jgi:rhodanese-related sulfurtransferase
LSSRYFCRPVFNLFFFITFCISSTSALSENKAPESIDGTTRVSAEQVIELVTNTTDLVVIDARKTSDRDEAGWIEGSIGLPNYDTNEETLQQHVPLKSTAVVFYCNGVKCGRSVESSKIAVSLGYEKVYWFRGGWEEWTEKGMPVSR